MLPPSPVIDHCKTAVLPPLALLAGAKLDIFTRLAHEPASVDDLAEDLDVDPDRLTRLLHSLVAAGLAEKRNSAYRNTEEADQFLVRGRPHFIGDVHKLFEDLWLGAFRAAESVKAGKPLSAHDFAGMDDEALETFFEGQHPDALLAGWKLADAIDWSAARRVADIGGGSGGVAIALCQRLRALQGAVIDLPNVARIADRRIAEVGVRDRLVALGCDLLGGPLSGDYDVAIVRALLQVLAPSECQAVLRNIRPALTDGARLIIIGQITDDDRVDPKTAAMYDLIFLSFYPEGRVYTEGEHRAWLEAAGYRDVERQVTANGLNMMIAHV